MKKFGEDRVLEPKGTTPASCWKLDNRREVQPDEIRIAIKRIVFERSNIDQIASISDYDEETIKAAILRLVEGRGKLQNPYTGTGGLFLGTVEEIGKDFDPGDLRIGDTVISMTTLVGLPMHLESIGYIDNNYGIMDCSGYIIGFESTVLHKIDEVLRYDYTHILRCLDEEGSVYGLSEELKNRKANRVTIIGSNIAETILYAGIVRKSLKEKVTVSLIVDDAYFAGITKEDLSEILGDLVDSIHFCSLSKPVEAAGEILKTEEPCDVVIIIENIRGTESTAALLVRDEGIIFYTSIRNNYASGVLNTDSLGKNVTHYNLDGISNQAYQVVLDLVLEERQAFGRLDAFYERFQNRWPHLRLEESRTKNVNSIEGFVYADRKTQKLIEEAANIAGYDCNVIIQGETGTGKEKICNLIHENSSRKDKAFVKINCATIQENLAESDFFGYEKGAFTGAQPGGKAGYFEMANNGTLFLDEIGSLSLNMQSKLLRVIQENVFYKVGGTVPRHVNVRILCANNVPLKNLVEEGSFREDLYYRLNICTINVPPLRERKEDIPCLAEAFMRNYSQKYGVTRTISEDAYKALLRYHWPGNVRELENTIHRLYIYEKNKVVSAYSVEMLLNEEMYDNTLLNMRHEIENGRGLGFDAIMEKQERILIEYALKKEETTRKAAEFLNLPQSTLIRKKNKYAL